MKINNEPTDASVALFLENNQGAVPAGLILDTSAQNSVNGEDGSLWNVPDEPSLIGTGYFIKGILYTGRAFVCDTSPQFCKTDEAQRTVLATSQTQNFDIFGEVKPTINSIILPFSYTGETIVVHGSGFSSDGNLVYLMGKTSDNTPTAAVITGVASSDGNTIKFKIPASTELALPVAQISKPSDEASDTSGTNLVPVNPGMYSIFLKNGSYNGNSNTISIRIIHKWW